MDRLRDDIMGADPVLHLVGRVTPSVLGVLRALTETLAETGAPQVVVAIDHPLAGLRADVRCIRIADDPGVFGRIRNLRAQLRACLAGMDVRSLHLHGVIPALAAVGIAGRLGRPQGEVVIHPHSSRALLAPAPVRAATSGLLALLLATPRWMPSLAVEQRRLHRGEPTPTGFTGGAVDDCFFLRSRSEAKRVLIIGGGNWETKTALQGFLQVAVLLGGDDRNLRFEWLGPVDDTLRPALKAAGVAAHESTDDDTRAGILSRCWVFVAPEQQRGFPVGVAEAMAAGAPCVVAEGDYHRELIAEGETGFFYPDTLSVLHRVTQLVDDAALRARIGAAARQLARERFSLSTARSRPAFAQVAPAHRTGALTEPASQATRTSN